jgi:regulation of enolase protein 1 (concanavalin A-like superfamily)
VSEIAAPSARTTVPWPRGQWLNPPVDAAPDGDSLLVTAAEGSDFWRTTSYGFVHDSGHALLVELPPGSAIEVSFVADFDQLYDQAGLLVYVDEAHWVKAGIEVSDGIHQLGAVTTRGVSDWSMAPVPSWAGREVTVRASRVGDAITLRARVDAEPWQLIRVTPLAPDAAATAGPLISAPTRGGLRVRFASWRIGPADLDLHNPGLD